MEFQFDTTIISRKIQPENKKLIHITKMSRFIKATAGFKHSVIYTDDSDKYFRFSDGTLAWRNHNPGNIWPGRISRKHNQIGVAYKLAVFPNYKSGHNALLDVLQIIYGNYSIAEMMRKYAPPHENN